MSGVIRIVIDRRWRSSSLLPRSAGGSVLVDISGSSPRDVSEGLVIDAERAGTEGTGPQVRLRASGGTRDERGRSPVVVRERRRHRGRRGCRTVTGPRPTPPERHRRPTGTGARV